MMKHQFLSYVKSMCDKIFKCIHFLFFISNGVQIHIQRDRCEGPELNKRMKK